ncbi:hypothetical protein MTO96_007396 [Rhipicephalus appendiculatus]
MAKMALAKNCFYGSGINYPPPCTSSEGRLCDIFRDLPLWNKYFWRVGIELSEDSPGELSLVEAYDASVCKATADHCREAATLVYHLLTQHRCVTSVDVCMNKFLHHSQLVCDALRESLHLRKLSLSVCEQFTHIDPSRNYASVLLHLTCLRELECGPIFYGDGFIEDLSEFLASTQSLTTLNMPGIIFGYEEDALVFMQGLKRNKTISTLSLSSSVLTPYDDYPPNSRVSSRCAVTFADYVSENQTLRTLTVGTFFSHRFLAGRPMIGALFGNNTLTKLSLVGFLLDDDDIQLITRLLNQNQALTSFNLIARLCRDVSSGIHSLLVALTENNRLEEVTLALPFNQHEYRSFFGALASNASLKKVIVKRFRLVDVGDKFRTMHRTGLRDRFLVGTHEVFQDTVVTLKECKELSSVSLDWHDFRGLEPLLIALSLLPSCDHVTSLRLLLHENKGEVSSSIARYVTGTAALRELNLLFCVNSSGDTFDEARRELVHALSVNKSIRRLRVFGLCFDETESGMLADTLQSSRALCYVYLHQFNDKPNSSLIQKLSATVSSNYSLLRLYVGALGILSDDWFTVHDVLRRNNSLVTRAADFVMSSKTARMRRKDYAAATELVQLNPGLVEKVQELASVDESEALSRIKSSLKSFSELDNFMRLAGVVKNTVSCHRRSDGQKQLIDLNRDCWLHLRRYLKLSDIVDEQ